jgi:hypothetical protein
MIFNILFCTFGTHQSLNFTLLVDETGTFNSLCRPWQRLTLPGIRAGLRNGGRVSGASSFLQVLRFKSANTMPPEVTITAVYAIQTYDLHDNLPRIHHPHRQRERWLLQPLHGQYHPERKWCLRSIGVIASPTIEFVRQPNWLATDPNALQISESFEADGFPLPIGPKTITNPGRPTPWRFFPPGAVRCRPFAVIPPHERRDL